MGGLGCERTRSAAEKGFGRIAVRIDTNPYKICLKLLLVDQVTLY